MVTIMLQCTACSGQNVKADAKNMSAVTEETGSGNSAANMEAENDLKAESDSNVFMGTEDDNSVNIETKSSDQEEINAVEGGTTDMNSQTGSKRIPSELAQIPGEYFTPASQQGTIERLDYQTYESMSYESRATQLDKTAYVYLPYGYSGDRQYNILYLMHGGWSNETTYLGTSENPHELKNIIDHAIQDGLMEPVIVVCPTYNNTSSEDSADYGLALRLTDNYHNELVNDLMPAVEGKYSTYAQGTSTQELKESRSHRTFGSFPLVFAVQRQYGH